MPKVQVVIVVAAALFTAQVAAADELAPDTKDRATAVALSAAGAAASIGVVAAGASIHSPKLIAAGLVGSLFAPAAGEIYAGDMLTAGMRIRIASVGVGFLAVLALESCSFGLGDAGGGSDGCSGGGALLLLAAGGYAAGIIYDIAAAGDAVDNYNQRLRLRVMPTVIPTVSSGTALGVGISRSF